MASKLFRLQSQNDDNLFEDLTLGLRSGSRQRFLEIFLVLVIVLLTFVMHKTAGYKLVVLNLFFLPIVLAGFTLGRYRAGILALLAVISASAVTTLSIGSVELMSSPIVTALSVLLWGAVLGLTAMIVGTLSDERAAKLVELHEAHVGVVDVLTRYLQTADPKLNARANRVARLSAKVAKQLKLSATEIDNIRVAALLQDLQNIEITARVIRKAVVDVEGEPVDGQPHTFHGSELAESLGGVLTGAFPLLSLAGEPGLDATHTPLDGASPLPLLAARILQTVRTYDMLKYGHPSGESRSPKDVIDEMRSDLVAQFDRIILQAMERVLLKEISNAANAATAAPVPADASNLPELIESPV
ncbi:MAG: hypothetical protein ACE5KM_20435 [Planctomycetaceae bacterium]